MGRFVETARYEVYSVRFTEEEKDLVHRLTQKEARQALLEAAKGKEK